MRNKFDSLGKLIVAAATDTPDRVQPEFAVLSEEQLADCYVIEPETLSEDFSETPAILLAPDQHPAVLGPRGIPLPRGGWLGEITSHECLVEAFHDAPSAQDLRLCTQKQLNLEAHLRREATRNKSPQREGPIALWIISGGDPETARRQLAFGPRPNWPKGFYSAASGFALHLVVTSALDPTDETLLL